MFVLCLDRIPLRLLISLNAGFQKTVRLEKSEPLRITLTLSKLRDFVHEGKAHAIGEVGRPHWPVSDEIWELSNDLLDETMHLAAQEGLPLQLHVE